MPRWLKIGLIIVFIIGLGLLALCIKGYRMVTGSLPQTRGEIRLSGLQAPVQVYRDSYHIPHVLAENEHDLFFAQGFVTAQDRLWQMDLWRRAAEGKLSEIFGRSTLKSDSLMLIVGIGRTARRIVPGLSPQSIAVYQAYTDGVNACIEENISHLPIEFLVLDYKPSEWRIEDCVAISRWLALNSSTAWKTDAILGTIVEKIGIEKAGHILPGIIPGSPGHALSKERFLSKLMDDIPQAGPIGFSSKIGAGSNGWVVSGDRSVTGKPLLANDPHLALSNPSVFYEIHIVGGGFNVSGLSLPGLPAVIIGSNENIAWGLTNLMADDMDLFIETFHPVDSVRYMVGGSYRNAEIVEESIPLRTGAPIRLRILQTRHGPVMPGVLRTKDTRRSAVSIRWTGHDFSDDGLAYYRLNHAYDWDSFREALREYGISPQQFIYADRDGNIGIQAAGRIPIKTNGPGYLPRLGENPDSDWQGFIPYDALPSRKNPKEGFLAAANERTESSYFISDLFALPSRIQRIHRLLSEKEKYSVMDFKQIQLDIQSAFAEEMMTLLRPVLETFPFDDQLERESFTKLFEWDARMRTGSPEAALFEVFVGKILGNLFRDELGDSLFNAFVELYGPPLEALVRILRSEDSPWIDDVTTENTVERKRDIIAAGFRETVSYLKERLGKSVSKWTWGELHALTFKHPLGQNSLLSSIFNIGPFHAAGSGTTVLCTGYDLSKPYSVQWGTSARVIIDLSNPDNSISVIPTGQSGQPMDDHYKDQVQLYLGNAYHPNLIDTTKIVRAGWDLLTLLPGGTHD